MNTMDTGKNKPKCEYGAACYRKNPNHRSVYWHPSDDTSAHEQPSKRQKITPGQNKQFHKQDGRLQTRQTTLQFSRKTPPVSHQESTQTKETSKDKVAENEKREKSPSSSLKETEPKNETPTKHVVSESEEESSEDDSPSVGWTIITNRKSQDHQNSLSTLKVNTVEEAIKTLYLVDMPADFYSFFDLCKKLNSEQPLTSLSISGLKLAGPFEVLSGDIRFCQVAEEGGLCHWRYYYDPPEFQTVLVNEKDFHLGYWRDDPTAEPEFVASNNATKGCIFHCEGENIYGAVSNYLSAYMKICDPFVKIKVGKLLATVNEEAKNKGYTLDPITDKIKARKKKVVSKSFHQAGIVVPVQANTELGYRPLIETEANIKKMCKAIMDSEAGASRETAWEALQVLVTAANIANDECDFGNSLELGIDLFCMGSSLFHDTIQHLLSTAYSLLNRPQFERIICTHLQHRSKTVCTGIARK